MENPDLKNELEKEHDAESELEQEHDEKNELKQEYVEENELEQEYGENENIPEDIVSPDEEIESDYSAEVDSLLDPDELDKGVVHIIDSMLREESDLEEIARQC